MSGDVIANEEQLRTFARAVQEAAGMPAEDAAIVADVLVWAELRGIWPQGVHRLVQHVARLRAGGTKAAPNVSVVRDTAGAIVLDGDHGFGHLVATRAMRMAAAKARDIGVGMVSVRNVTHAGPLGAHAIAGVDEGVIGLAINNTPPLMAPWGGTGKLLGNQAFALASPAGRHHPVLFDSALSAISWAQIFQLQGRGESLPPNVALDSSGNPTRDPAAALAGQLLPTAGHKGYGLILMWEILTGVLAGGKFAPEPSFPDQYAQPTNISLFVLAIDPRLVMPYEDFLARVDRLIDDIHASPPAAGFERVFVPGEQGFAKAEANRLNGVTIPAERADPLRTLANELGVAWMTS